MVFTGSNLYYAAGLSTDDRKTLLSGMKDAGMKVLRVWLDGQSTGSTKGTTITSYPSLEPDQIGTYDDTVLNLLDDFMIDAQSYGVKLLVSMHSFNSLSAGDVYGAEYGTGYFYEQAQPQQQFDARLQHVLNHVHSTLGKPWSQLSDYIFAFEAENEAMIGKGQDYIVDHQQWQCDRANTIKQVLGDSSGILVCTGGESWMDESVQDGWLNCPSIDMISVHSYGTGDFETSAILPYVQRAKNAGKLLVVEEWGACYTNTENNQCHSGDALDTDTRNNNIQTWANQIVAAGVSWMYWQVLPNPDPHADWDYEIGIGDDGWDALKTASLYANTQPGAFDFSAYLPN